MTHSFDLMHIIVIIISTHFALIAPLIPTCSSHTLRHAHYRNIEAIRRAAAETSADNYDIIFLDSTPHWLNQTLDHFAPELVQTSNLPDFPGQAQVDPYFFSSRYTFIYKYHVHLPTVKNMQYHGSPKFLQRYYEFLDYFDAPHGPIFLTICGESTCDGILNDFVGVLARRFGAAVVALEHRYYGYSSPFSNLTTHNLRYLTSKQALSDLAAFRSYYQDVINQRFNLSYTADNPWITFGGSYAGALSAWFRLKFPHLARGSVASSAVIHAIENYFAFDEQVAESVGPDCSQALQAVKMAVNNYMEKNATQLKSLFDAEVIEENVDFLSLLADSTALAAQYGFQEVLCKPLVESFQTGKNVLVAYQYFVENTIYGGFGVKPLDYNREYIKNSTLAGPLSGPRSWTYQFCTEFGFLQIAPANNSIRFSQLDREYYLDLCSYIFGKGTSPRSKITNLYYGGSGIAGSRIFFTNGSQDPWRHASKQVSTSDEPAFVIKCKNCAHCVDLSGCPQFPFNPRGDASLCEPRDSIDKARKLIIEYIELWIRD